MHRSLYFSSRVYIILGIAALVFVCSFFFPFLFSAGKALLVLLLIAVLADGMLLYMKKGIASQRELTDRFSIGDDNDVQIRLVNSYPFPVSVKLIDELPSQFQERNWSRSFGIKTGGIYDLRYTLRPVERGEYEFGITNIYVSSPLRLVVRGYFPGKPQVVKVYPSYKQMRKYHLLAISNRLQEAGVKKIRKIGQSMEFEQIKEYVRGDDHRTINWKATARKGELMVNNFTDERSQQIYCIINKGRVMKMPFEEMTLLDYSINASLVLANVAMVRQDKAGLITFAENLDSFIPADKKPTQINLLLESLYRQKTRFLEPDLEKLFSVIRNRISHRSMLVLFTNYESLESLDRDLPSLKKIAKYHLLLVILFENTELRQLHESRAELLEDIYIKTTARKYIHDKRLMIRELNKNGILAILSTPENLTVNTINKYLEVKTRMSL